MTGGEHYREAERLLSDASFVRGLGSREPVDRQGKPINEETRTAWIARAHVHATLALAAAMVDDVWGRAQILEPPREELVGDRS